MFVNDSQQEVKQKLLILYTIDEFKIPLTNSQLTDFIMELNFMDYFSLQQYLTELTDKSILEYSETPDGAYYLITENGRKMLEFFNDRIYDEFKVRIQKSITLKKKDLHKNTQIYAEYVKNSDHDYTVMLKVEENDFTLINLELNLVSNKQAKAVCKNWKENASDIYTQIIHQLVPDEEA